MADIDVKRIDEMIYYLKTGELADMEILLEAITRTLDNETQANTINELNVCKQMLDEINQLLQTVEQNKQKLGERLNLLADGDNFENRRLEQKKEIYEPFKEEIVKFIKRMDNMKEFEVPSSLSDRAKERLQKHTKVSRSELVTAIHMVDMALLFDMDWKERLAMVEVANQELTKKLGRLYETFLEAKGNFSKSIDDCIDSYESSNKSIVELEEYKNEIELDFKMAKNNLERAQEFLDSYLSFKLI